VLITHYDADGKTCLVLAKKFLKNIGRYSICDYGNVNETVSSFLDTIENYKNDDAVLIITDISISESVAERIDKNKERFNFLLLIDHHPANNQHLKKYEWCKLYESNISATKAFYEYLKEIGLVDNNDYDDLVTAVDEWDTWKWEETGNTNAKIINDLSYNLKTHDYLNRFLINPSLNLSKKEKLILGMREDDIQATIEKIQPIIKGKTCYVFIDKYVAETTINIFEKYKDVDILIAINPINRTISYRSRTDEYDVSKIASRNGGGGHRRASGSPFNEDVVEALINIILRDGFRDYTKEDYI
jgi:oligoribonuclease NrnB/cAMP/cGMP phosphodiesterase (DHH superfamily)